MLVSDCAGPSCIARAISRRRSSWALSTIRDSVGAAGAASSRPALRRPVGTRLGRELVGNRGHRRAVTDERLALALEEVDLALHQHGALRERDQLRPRLRRLPGVRRLLRVGPLLGRPELLGRLRPLLLVTGGFGPGLPDEHLDLGQLVVEPCDIDRESGGKLLAGAVRAWLRGRDQSSGIRIQPWRIAYTTAWVRSLTESFRRMELMWFLTVCSEIDRA